ncbi:MAG: hypothetical protein PHV43_02300 [Candidatus Colwellbacteria bacterium]|nr:hypothetical protein [Candidatus Colwellbacteria bacterium]
MAKKQGFIARIRLAVLIVIEVVSCIASLTLFVLQEAGKLTLPRWGGFRLYSICAAIALVAMFLARKETAQQRWQKRYDVSGLKRLEEFVGECPFRIHIWPNGKVAWVVCCDGSILDLSRNEVSFSLWLDERGAGWWKTHLSSIPQDGITLDLWMRLHGEGYTSTTSERRVAI